MISHGALMEEVDAKGNLGEDLGEQVVVVTGIPFSTGHCMCRCNRSLATSGHGDLTGVRLENCSRFFPDSDWSLESAMDSVKGPCMAAMG